MKHKSFFRAVSLLICVLTVFSAVVSSFSADSFKNTVVTTDAVRLRSTPEISDDNFIVTLGVFEELTLLADSENGWARVKRENGDEGYCSVNYLNVPDDSSAIFCGTASDDLNLREGPSTDYPIIDCLASGQDFLVVDNSAELWVKISVDGNEGYVYREYTSLTLKSGVPSEDATKATVPVETWVSSEAVTAVSPSAPTSNEAVKLEDPKTPNWYGDYILEASEPSLSTDFGGDFRLSKNKLSLNVGESFKLSVLMLGSALDISAYFKSSDAKVASVSRKGVVTALSQGEAKITASFGGKEAVCTVIVTGKSSASVPATEPTTAPMATEAPTTVAPTKPQVLVLSASKATVEKGNWLMLTSSVKNTSWSSGNGKVASVNNGLVTALSEGEAVITAKAEGQTATCKITVTKATSGVSVEYSRVTLSKGKTFYNAAEASERVSWKSSDNSVALVTGGFITGVGEGTAVITASTAKSTKTCLVTVKKAEPIRFTYAYPNTAAKNEAVKLVAITDKTRTAVQFKVEVNGTLKTVNATSKKADGNTLVWTGETSFSQAGTYNVTAYAKSGSYYSTCDGGDTAVFVRKSDDLLKETQEDRRVSDDLIALLASFEGYVGNVYFDDLAGGIPTLGYGKVVYTGDSFYNDMTKTEAYALLYDTVNNGGYSENVNSYLQDLNANYNQQQFDALVSFAYNIGYYGLKSDSEIHALILEAKEKKSTSTAKNSAYINGTQVNIRSGAGTEHDSLGLLNYPEGLTLVENQLINGAWYHVKTSDGVVGYVYKDYVTLGTPTTDGDIYLSLIDRSELTRVILEYHHAGGSCIYGLLYRRVDELDLFYYGDYDRDGDDNRFGYYFTCVKDSSFGL